MGFSETTKYLPTLCPDHLARAINGPIDLLEGGQSEHCPIPRCGRMWINRKPTSQIVYWSAGNFYEWTSHHKIADIPLKPIIDPMIVHDLATRQRDQMSRVKEGSIAE